MSYDQASNLIEKSTTRLTGSRDSEEFNSEFSSNTYEILRAFEKLRMLRGLFYRKVAQLTGDFSLGGPESAKVPHEPNNILEGQRMAISALHEELVILELVVQQSSSI